MEPEKDETIEREEDVRRHVGGMPLLTDLSLAMRIDPLALIRGVTEFVTVIYGPAVTFAFPDVKVEAYRRSVLHLNLISAVDGSTLNWCEQHALRELMSEDLLFAKISEPEMTVINFDDHFCDRMGEVERGHIEVFPKLWNLRPYDETNGEMTRVPRLTAAYHKVREETKDWGDYKKLPEAIPEFPLIRRMLLGAVSVVQTPRLRAFETNERRVGNFMGTMDPYFVGEKCRRVKVHTICIHGSSDEKANKQRRYSQSPGRFDEEWKGLGLAPMRMRGRTELPEASLILTSVRKEMKVGGVLQTRTFLAPFAAKKSKWSMEKKKINRPVHCSYRDSMKKPTMTNKDHRTRIRISQKEMTDRVEAVRLKNPCNKIKLVGKTTGHRQEEHPAWILTSSVILKTMRIRWKQLSQRMKAPRHWSLRQPLWK